MMFNSEAGAKGRAKQRELAKQNYSEVSDFINGLKASDPNISLQKIANSLNASGFKTRQGKNFTPMQIKRILDRGGNGSFSPHEEEVTASQQQFNELNELKNLFKREQHKVGQAYLQIAALKQQNHELKTRLERAGIEIRGLLDERDKQRDIISQERDRLLVEVEQLRAQVSKAR